MLLLVFSVLKILHKRKIIIKTFLITSIFILLKNISQSLYLKSYRVISFFSKITVADLIADLLIAKI